MDWLCIEFISRPYFSLFFGFARVDPVLEIQLRPECPRAHYASIRVAFLQCAELKGPPEISVSVQYRDISQFSLWTSRQMCFDILRLQAREEMLQIEEN